MEDGAMVTLRVFRFNPNVDKAPWHSQYSVPWSDGLSLLEAIRYVYYNVDRTLSFHDYYCGRGLCQGCILDVDGRTQRGCHIMLKRDATYLVEPPAGYPVIRDLRVDFGVPVRTDGGDLLWVKDGVRVELAAKAAAEEEVQ